MSSSYKDSYAYKYAIFSDYILEDRIKGLTKFLEYNSISPNRIIKVISEETNHRLVLVYWELKRSYLE